MILYQKASFKINCKWSRVPKSTNKEILARQQSGPLRFPRLAVHRRGMLKHELQRDKERTWPAAILRFVGLPLGFVLFYLLSLGPVTRFYARVVWAETGVPGVNAVGMVQVEPPYWVYLLYYPAFWLSWTDSTYGAYVRWWEPWDRRD